MSGSGYSKKAAATKLKNSGVFVRQGTKTHPCTPKKKAPVPDGSTPIGNEPGAEDPIEVEMEAEETTEESLSEESSGDEEPKVKHVDEVIQATANEWFATNAPSIFAKQVDSWLDDFGPELLAVQITRRLVAEKSKNRTRSGSNDGVAPSGSAKPASNKRKRA